MNERMLDRTKEPSFGEMLDYCGDSGRYWLDIEDFMKSKYELRDEIRFPYGKEYGWGKSYKNKNKHICDIHAELNSFTVFFQIRTEAIEKIRNDLSDYAVDIWEKRYPCGSGGWIRYRVTCQDQVDDICLLLSAKVKPCK